MSRFVLDCAVSRPVDAEVGQWLSMAATRGWAAATGGYHEAKISQALLQEAARTLTSLTGGAHARFVAEPSTAVAHAVLEMAVTGRYAGVATSAADPLVLQEASAAAAAQAGLPHQVLPVDARARIAGLPDVPVVLVTAAANQEIGSVQRDVTDWLDSSGSALVLEASCAYGWIDLPQRWDRLLLDPRAWGGVAGCVAVLSTSPGRHVDFDNVPAAVVAGLSGRRWAQMATAQAVLVRDQVAGLVRDIADRVPDVDIHGGGMDDLPHIVSLSVLYVDAEALQTRLDALGYAVGSGSACASRSGQPSHVLEAIGGLTSGNVRVGLAPGLPQSAVAGFTEAFAQVVAQVRQEMGVQGL